jgi:hypothetical protein
MLGFLALIFFLTLPIFSSGDFSALVAENQPQAIRLKTKNIINEGSILNLPIDIPEPVLSLDGKRPSRLKSISCHNSSGFYTIGDDLHIYLEYFADVLVSGDPAIVLNTGCNSASCVTWEVQSFRCQATRGMFAMQMEDDVVMNIDVNTTAERFEQYLRRFPKIQNVSVEIIPGDDNPYNENRLCSDVGNEVVITFFGVNFPEHHGDVPKIALNRYNDYPSSLTRLSQGIDTNFLKGRQHGDKVFLSDETTEVVKGANRTNMIVPYSYGNNTNKITFVYTVVLGDIVDNLDVIGLNFSIGNISSRFGTGLVSQQIPPLGRGYRYMSSSAGSLSSSFSIGVASFLASVVNVTSPNATATYTVGDELFVDVTFDLSVRVSDASLITLTLALSLFSREATFHSLINNGHTVRFLYDVQVSDSASVLETRSSSSLKLNGGKIYVRAGTKDLDALLTLPEPYSSSSLSAFKTLTINPNSPIVAFVRVLSPDGNYTAGDSIYLEAVFSTTVYVEGRPRIALTNTPRDFDVDILTAPHLPQLGYRRSFPSGITQINLQLSCNVEFVAGDRIILDLPRLMIVDPDITFRRRVTVDLHGGTSMNFTGFWHDIEKRLILTVNGSIPRFEDIEILIAGRSSLFIDSYGIGAPYQETITFDAESIRSSYAFDLPISNVEDVGYSNISANISPLSYDSSLSFLLDLSFPEYLSYGDTFILYLDAFSSNFTSSTHSSSFSSSGYEFSTSYDKNESTLTAVITGSSNGFKSSSFQWPISQSLEIRMPDYGIDSSTLLLSLESEKNGNINMKPIVYIPNVCSSPSDGSVGVFYYNYISDAPSAVRFTFPSGIFGLAVGDKVVFTLSQLAAQGFSNFQIDSSAIYGDLKTSFDVSLTGSTVIFAVTSSITKDSIVDISVDQSVGIKTPATGIQVQNADKFAFRVISSLCAMASARMIPYSEETQILYVSNGILELDSATSSFGSLTSIGMKVNIANPGLAAGDVATITLPGFSRSINYILFNTSNIISNANVTVRFNRRVPRFEITFLESFSGPLELNVTNDALMFLPTTSLSATAFQLNIFSSVYGQLRGYTMKSKCIGFCSSAVQFSSQFTDEPQTVVINFSYSNAIPAGSNINIKFQGVDVDSTAVIRQGSTLVSFVQSGDLYFNVTTASTIAAYATSTLVVSGVRLNEIAVSTLTVTLYYYDSALVGVASVSLDCPDIYTRPYFRQSNFTVDAGNVNKFQMNFLLAENRVLVAGHFVDIKLNDFSYLGVSLASDLSDNLGLIDKTVSSYSAATETLRIVLQRTLNDTERWTIEMREISLPAKGLSANSSIVNYQIGFDSSISSLITLRHSFGTVDEYITVSDPRVELYAAANDSTIIEFIRLQFDVTSPLDAGEKIYLNLPRLALRDSSVATTVNIGATGNFRGSALWDKVANRIVTTLSEQSSLQLDLIFNTSSTSANFAVQTSGIPEGSRFYVLALDTNLDVIANGTGLLPCVGICDISIKPLNRNPGRSSAFYLNASLGNVLLNFNDELELFLSGFTSLRPMELYNISCSSYGSSEIRTFTAQWMEEFSSLRIKYLPQVTFYGSELMSNLYCFIPQDYNLQLPQRGIRASELFSANLTLVNSGVVTNYLTDVVRFETVGAPLSSVMTISPKQSNIPVAIEFSFEFYDDITSGDFMYIYLPNFDVPSRSIQVFSSNELHVRMVGFAAGTTEETNPDDSVYYEESISRLQVQILSDVPAGELLRFNFTSDAGILSPVAGLYTVPFPWFSLHSDSSPISGVTFHNITKIGTLSPAALRFSDASNSTMEIYDLLLNFTLFCPLLENDTIYVNTPIFIESSANAHIVIDEFNSSRNASIQFASIWLNGSSMVAITLQKGYILSGDVFFRLRFFGFSRISIVLYPNDQSFFYESSSTICPITSTPFDEAPTFFVSSATAALVPLDEGDGSSVSISFAIKPIVNLYVGDILAVNLSKVVFDGDCLHNICDLSLSHAQRQLLSSVRINVGAGSSQLEFTLARNISGNSVLRLATSSLTNSSFSTTQFVIDESDVFYALYRNVTSTISSVPELETVFFGNVQSVSLQPYLLSSSIEVLKPVAGSISGLTIDFKFSGAIGVEDKIIVYLPSFSLYSGYLTSWIFVSDDATQQFVVQWDTVSQSLILTPRLYMAALSDISVLIDMTRGIVLPTMGIPVIGSTFTLTLSRSGIVRFRGVVEDVTNVPYIALASISFLSCDVQDSYNFNGNLNALQLVPGHELSSGDIGSMITINNTVYFISDLQNNVLYLETGYQGRRVFLGSPDVTVSSPQYRFANYINGSGSDTLVFEYHVDRGDFSTYLSLYSLMTSIDLNGGKILRFSMKPRLPSALSISLFQNNFNKRVNTDFPSVLNVFTTSSKGAYGEGQLIDIWLQFSFDVVLQSESALPVPQIILSINNTGYGYAKYHHGSGTNRLMFLYEVQSSDLQLRLSSLILNDDDPIYQPLRIITGNTESHLFRKAKAPFLDADLRLGNASFGFPVSQMWLGAVAQIEDIVIISESSLGTSIYTAGETIELLVTFSKDISVELDYPDSLGPYIVLDMGNGRSSNAYFVELLDSNSAVFSYEFTSMDVVSQGLYLTCQCEDYLQRTFIQLNGSSIVSSEIGLPAALMIASSPSSTELLISSNVIVDNGVPSIISVSSNASSGIIAPGSIVEIYVTYSVPVMVIGLVSLQLRGEFSSCRAGFYHGNGTSTFTFLYHVSGQSGVARLDCSDADAIDVSLGRIYKLSTIASIEAVNDLPTPGAPDALGRVAAVNVDPTPALLLGFEVLHTQSSDFGVGPILSVKSLPFNIPRMEFESVFDQCGCDSMKETPIHSQDLLALIGKVDAEYYALNATTEGYLYNYDKYLLTSLYPEGFDALPTSIQRCFNWWKLYEVSNSLLVSMHFNRPVAVKNGLLSISDNIYLNSALSSKLHRSYVLSIKKIVRPSEDAYFLFRSGGIISSCLPQSVDADKIRGALKSIPSIAVLQPIVQNPVLRQGQILDFEIILQRDEELEILLGHDVEVMCVTSASFEDVQLSYDKEEVLFRYQIESADGLVLVANETIIAGSYQVNFTGPVLSSFGVEKNEFIMRQLSSYGFSNGSASMISNSIGRITLSSLYFGSKIPGEDTYFRIEICSSVPFVAGDSISVYFPAFNHTNYDRDVFDSTSKVSAYWSAGNSSIVFTFLTTSFCIGDEETNVEYPISLRSQGIYRNDAGFYFSVDSSSFGHVTGLRFDTVSPVGFASITINFNDTRPFQPTEVQLSWESLIDLEPGNDTIRLNLPEFYAADIKRADIFVAGSLNGLIGARWSNKTSTLYLSPLVYIPAGIYKFAVQSTIFPLSVGPLGVSTEFPPSLQVADPHWTMSYTTLQSFPLVYGYENAYVEFGVNSSYYVTELILHIYFTRDVNGPAEIQLSIPGLSDLTGYTFVDGSENSFGYDNASWFEYNNTWLFRSQIGWTRGVDVGVRVRNLDSFKINDVGVFGGLFSGLSFAVVGADGETPMSPITVNESIPIMSNAKFTLQATQNNAFYNGDDTMTISFHINTFPTLQDTFRFRFDDTVLNFSMSTIVDPCYNISAWSADISTKVSLLDVRLANGSTTCHYRRVRDIHLEIESVQYPMNERRVKQYGQRYAWHSWITDHFQSDFFPFDESVLLGMYSSSVEFSNPFAGRASDFILKVLTATSLSALDTLIVTIPGLRVPWDKAIVLDQYRRSWDVTFSNVSAELSFVTPRALLPSALQFQFSHFIVPSSGITYNRSSSYAIELRRPAMGWYLEPDAIKFVTPVGLIIDSYVRLRRSIIGGNNKFSFLFELNTLNPLFAGDTIDLEFVNIGFHHPAVLTLDGDLGSNYKIETVSKSSVRVTVFDQQFSNLVSLSVTPTNVIYLKAVQCNDDDSCLTEINVASFSNPVREVNIACNGNFLSEQSSIIFSYRDKYYHENSTFNSSLISVFNSSDNIIGLTFNFSLQHDLPQNGHLILNLDSHLNITGIDASQIIQLSDSLIPKWSAAWYNDSRIILNPLAAFDAGNYSIDLKSLSFHFDKDIIFENEIKVSYELFDGFTYSDRGYVQNVGPWGLRNVDLTWLNTQPGVESSFRLKINAVESFLPGDIVILRLPGVICPNSTIVTRNSNFNGNVTWDSSNNDLLIRISKGRPTNIEFSVASHFFLPEVGVSNFFNAPSVAFNRTECGMYFGFTNLPIFQKFAPVLHSNISFSPRAPYVWSTVQLLLTTEGLEFSTGDVIVLTLPQFSSVSDILVVMDSAGIANWTGVWSNCEEKVFISLGADEDSVSFSTLSLSLGPIRLPPYGINPSNSLGIAVNVESSVYDFVTSSLDFVEKVGYVQSSSLKWVPGRLQELNTAIVSLQLSSALNAGDEIILKFPGLNMTACTADILPVGLLRVDFNRSKDFAVLTALHHIPNFELIEINTSSCFELHYSGFPDVSRSPQDYTVSVRTQLFGSVDDVPFEYIPSIGITFAELTYGVLDIERPLSMRLDMELTDDLQFLDTINLHIPVINYTLFDADMSVPLLLRGDWAETNFEPFFEGILYPNRNLITLTCNNSVVKRRHFSVYLGMSNLIELGANTSNLVFVSANISQIGTISQIPVAVAPLTLPVVRDASLQISNCNHKGICQYLLDFVLVEDLPAKSSLVLSSASWQLPHNHSLKIESPDTDALFDAHWRFADNVDAMIIPKQEWFTINSDGFDWTDADMDVIPMDKSVDEFLLPWSAIATTDIPRIVRYGFLNWTYNSVLAYEDAMLFVEFSQEVDVYNTIQVLPRILLNTGENAIYCAGSGSKTLIFKYTPFVPKPVDALCVAGGAGLELLSSGLIFSSKRANVAANLTFFPPFELYQIDEGYRQKVKVTPTSSAEVLSIFEFSQNITYGSGDILDIGITFNRPIVVEGTPELALHYVGGAPLVGSDVYYGLRYINVSSVQYLNIDVPGDFAVVHDGTMTDCLTTNHPEDFVRAISSLPGLAWSLPLTMRRVANDDIAMQFRFSFHGIAPALLSIQTVHCNLRATASFAVESKMLNTLVFRTEIKANNPTGNLTYFNYTSLVLRNLTVDSASIALAAFKRALNDSLLSPPEGLVKIDNSQPFVLNVSSNFYEVEQRVAVSGDTIPIFVSFNAKIIPRGTILLEILLENLLDSSIRSRNISLSGFHNNFLVFDYEVAMGEVSSRLRSSRLLIEGNSSVFRMSRIPAVPANLDMPGLTSDNSLYASNIAVNATELPKIMRVYNTGNEPVLNAGMKTVVGIQFSSAVRLILTNSPSTSSPFIPLQTPEDRALTYLSGEGSSLWLFNYTVRATDNPGNMSFYFSLKDGYGIDVLNQSFANLSESRLYVVEDLLINTLPPYVRKVDCNCEDGTYYPGQVLDIFVEFNEPIVMIHSDASQHAQLPQLEIFTHTQYGENVLANYWYGNGTNQLHFRYVVPPPNINSLSLLPFALDYAGVLSLRSYLHGTVLKSLSSNPETVVDDLLPTMDVSYLVYKRRLYLYLAWSRVESVSLLREGIYTVGDVVTVMVNFTTPVMFANPAPYFILNFKNANVTAKYAHGNRTKTLWFTYTVKAGDTARNIDYIQTDLPPYNSDILDYSFPLIAYDDFNRNVYGKAQIGLYMFSEIAQYGVPVPFPLPGTEGSIAFHSRAIVETSIPRIIWVTTLQPSGTYGYPQVLTIYVTFSWPVVVSGCPRIVFVVQGVMRYATYSEGNGTSTLTFDFPIMKSDFKIEFDYESPYSFELTSCAGSSEDVTYIRRVSDNPTLHANLTMPFVNFRPTVTSPSSILATGINITLAGDTAIATRVTTPAENNTVFSFGDLVLFRIVFSGPLSVNEPNNWLEVGSAVSSGELYQNALFANQSDSNSLQYTLIPGPYDTLEGLSYLSSISLKSADNCPFFESDGDCVAQNLPRPAVFGSAGDELTRKNISIKSSRSRAKLVSLEFVYPDGKEYFASGDPVKIIGTFSEAVTVIGQPILRISINDSYTLPLGFEKELSASQLQFTRVVGTDSLSGVMQCGRLCQIDTANGLILRKGNFLPVANADTTIPNKRCQDASCTQIESVLYSEIPVVVSVFSNATGVQTLNDTISIFVEFSAPVRVNGSPKLVLSLHSEPTACFVSTGTYANGVFNSLGASMAHDVLLFQYKVRPVDRTSALEYSNVNALLILDNNGDPVDFATTATGILSASLYADWHVNYLLPIPGTRNSLGVTSVVVIDQSRPNVVSIITNPATSTTCGDLMIISLIYNQPMALVSIIPSILNSPPSSQIKLSLALVSSSNGLLKNINATFGNLTDNVLTFSLLITSNEPVGRIVLGSKSPLYLGKYSLQSKFTRVSSPVVFDDSLVSGFGIPIVRNLPRVQSVSSPNTTTSYSYGVGDVLFIDVLFNVPVRVDGGVASLYLSLDGVTRVAEFNRLKAGNTIIEFVYVVQGDDHTERLTYRDVNSLSGGIYQISRCDAPVPANLTLPDPGSPESVSGCCPISIDSTPPFIRSIFPVKVQGSYGENEPLLVVARFSIPVVVIGYPYLMLQVGENRTAAANYTPTGLVREMFQDITIDLLSTDVGFIYYIDANDDIDNMVHAGANALVVGSSIGRILQLSDNPAYDADTSLRSPSDLSKESGSVSRQWKYRFFQSMDILLRDFYHTNPQSLSVVINHEGTSGVVFQGCCHEAASNPQPRFFGYNKNYYTGGTVSTVFATESEKQGEDLLFSDSTAPNIALLQGKATQSSTIRAASLAIDGGYSAVVGDGSVSETVQETNPWWHLAFNSPQTPVQTIAIYERLPQTWVQAVVQFTIKGLDRLPSGFFRLRFSNFNPSNESLSLTTSFIKIGAEAESVLKAIVPLSPLGNVQVEKRVLPLCVIEGRPETYGGGCGIGVDYGYGASYKLTFLSLLVSDPIVEIVDLKYPGEPLQDNGTRINVNTQYLAQKYPISLTVKRLRSGFYKPVFKQYQGEEPGEDTTLTNQWLTPFVIYMFNESIGNNVPTNITIAKQVAIWYLEITSIDKVRIITLPKVYNVASLRIQRIGAGQLSLTEVAVYSTALRGLDSYNRGSPVQNTELGSMYNPATPLQPVYSEMPYDGVWVVTVSQGSSRWKVKNGVVPQGSISEAVIVVTDMAGVVTTYYQDIYAVVESLPRYGTLFTTESGSLLGYTSWHEAFGLLYGRPIMPDVARSIRLGQCAADPNGNCLQNVPSTRDYRIELTQQVKGDKPLLKTILRSERILYYVPDPGFQGQDFFTYSTYFSSSIQQQDQTVTMVVQPCRLFLNRTTSFGSIIDVEKVNEDEVPEATVSTLLSGGSYWSTVSDGLCHCAPSPLAVVSNEGACIRARANLCRSAAFREHFYDMCLSCYGNSLAGELLESNYRSNDAADCRAQTIRAASLLLLRGMCANTTTSIQSVAEGASQLNTNGTTSYSAYFASHGVGIGRQAIIPNECLITRDSTDRLIMRRNYVSAQQRRPSKD